MIKFMILFLTTVIALIAGNELAMGWGDYNWTPLDKVLSSAAVEDKPILLLFWRSWCHVCKNLMPKFAEDTNLKHESSNFIMANIGDDSSFTDDKYAPDGGYFPRILFLKSDGTLIEGISNIDGNPKYSHFYATPEQIIGGMKRAWRKYNRDKLESDDFDDRSMRFEEL